MAMMDEHGGDDGWGVDDGHHQQSYRDDYGSRDINRSDIREEIYGDYDSGDDHNQHFQQSYDHNHDKAQHHEQHEYDRADYPSSRSPQEYDGYASRSHSPAQSYARKSRQPEDSDLYQNKSSRQIRSPKPARSPRLGRKGNKPARTGGGGLTVVSGAMAPYNPKRHGTFIAKPDFDARPAKKSVIQPLGMLEKEPYGQQSPRPTKRLQQTKKQNTIVRAPIPSGVKLAKHEKSWDRSHIKANVLEKTALPSVPLGGPAKPMKVAGDLVRFGNNIMRDEPRFISPKDWAVMQRERIGKREESIVLESPPGSPMGHSKYNDQPAFLTQLDEDITDSEGNANKDELNVPQTLSVRSRSPSSARRRENRPPTPKVLKVKPNFDPTAYHKRQQQRMVDESKRRAELVAAGENPNTVNMLKYKVREKPVFVIKQKPRKIWHATEVKDMLDFMIRVENVKLRALDELLEDLTKGARAGMMEERLAPLRLFIKGVRNRITYHREAKMLVMKQTWHADLKQLRVGGSNGISLDHYLSIVSDLYMEDKVKLVNDTPTLLEDDKP